jgi:phospholipase C
LRFGSLMFLDVWEIVMNVQSRVVAYLAVTCLAGCAGLHQANSTGANAGVVPSIPQSLASSAGIGTYIKHVVIIVQENRSLDNLFAGFPNADAHMYGYEHDGTKVTLQSIPFQQKYLDHYLKTAIMDWDNGKMDHFDLEKSGGNEVPAGKYPYSYVERSETTPYWAMAQQYVLADHMFPTLWGASFTAHLTLIAGTADLTPTLTEADVPTATPWGCDAPRGTKTDTYGSNGVEQFDTPQPPCFTQFHTMADTLDAAGVSWKYYAPAITQGGGDTWSSFDAIKKVRYSSDWTNRVISPPQTIFTDASKGQLAGVSWVIPDANWSDHPDAGTPYGPSWVSAVVNAVGNSSAWKTTAIVVVWDDWGGWFDDAAPPQKDFRGLSIRVPCLIISPYVKPHVSHTVYEFGSILKFVEQVYGLPPLGPQSAGYTDGRANSLVDSFDFSIAPRAFKTIPAPYPPSFFVRQKPSLRPPDDY